MYWKSHSKETDPKVALKKYTQFIDPQLIEILIGDHLFDMEVSSDHSVGLSQRKKMNCEGMIFILDEVRDAQFHMKDCYFPLDIILKRYQKIVLRVILMCAKNILVKRLI